MPQRRWTSLHVFYDGDLDCLVTDLVGEVTGRLVDEDASAGLFFLRYWDGGPHLRLRVRPRHGREADVRRILTATTDGFLDRRPAPDRMSQETYAAIAAVLATAEAVPDHERHRRPNNSHAFVPYRPETHKYGTGTTLHRVEDHFVTCSRLVRQFLADPSASGHRATAAFAILALTWWTGLSRTGPPHTDHRRRTPTADEQGILDDSYRRQRDRLTVIAERMRTLAATPPADPAGFLDTWARSITGLAGHLDAEAVWRVLDNCAHLACNRLGLLPAVEGELRHLCRRTFSDLAGPPARLSATPPRPDPDHPSGEETV